MTTLSDLPEVKPWRRWSVLWRQDKGLDGTVRRLQGDGGVLPLFETRQQARDFIKERYGYIANSADLKEWPHGWKMPVPVRVEIRVAE